MAISKAQQEAVKRYTDKNYDFIKVRVNKGQREILKQRAEAEGKSLNQYIVDLIL